MQLQVKTAITEIKSALESELTPDEVVALFLASSSDGDLWGVMGFSKLLRINSSEQSSLCGNLLQGNTLKPFAAKAIGLMALDVLN